MIFAVLVTTETSASTPATSPAPTAGPWMAETMGLRAVDDVVDEVAGLAHRAGARVEVRGELLHQVERAARREALALAAQQDRLHAPRRRRTRARSRPAGRARPRSRR